MIITSSMVRVVVAANLPALVKADEGKVETLVRGRRERRKLRRARNRLAWADKDSERTHSQRGTRLVSWASPCGSKTKQMHLGLGPGCQGNCCSSCLGPAAEALGCQGGPRAGANGQGTAKGKLPLHVRGAGEGVFSGSHNLPCGAVDN